MRGFTARGKSTERGSILGGTVRIIKAIGWTTRLQALASIFGQTVAGISAIGSIIKCTETGSIPGGMGDTIKGSTSSTRSTAGGLTLGPMVGNMWGSG